MLRRLGRAVLPQSGFRTLLNKALLTIERRGGTRLRIADVELRFILGSEPYEGGAAASAHEQLDAIQLSAFARAIKPGNWVADVGAYRGAYTAVAAVVAGQTGRVFAFEPMPANADYIARNARLNGVADRVEIITSVVSDTNEPATFFHSGTSSANSLFRTAIEQHAPGSVETTVVPATTLDAFFGARERLPDVVKIDVEGAEWRVLRGAERMLASDAIIFCELHPYAWPEAGENGDEMRSWLRTRGRDIIDIETGRPIVEWRYGPALLRKMSV